MRQNDQGETTQRKSYCTNKQREKNRTQAGKKAFQDAAVSCGLLPRLGFIFQTSPFSQQPSQWVNPLTNTALLGSSPFLKTSPLNTGNQVFNRCIFGGFISKPSTSAHRQLEYVNLKIHRGKKSFTVSASMRSIKVTWVYHLS